MKTVAIVALVLLIVLTALPLGMVMGSCPNTHLPCGAPGFGVCAGVLFLLFLLLPVLRASAKPPRASVRLLVLATALDRPPRR